MGIEKQFHQTTGSVSTPSDPPVGGFVVTPHNTNQLNNGTIAVIGRAVSIGGAGDLKVTYKDGTTSVIPSANLVVGLQYSMQITHIWSTGTTATAIYVWY